MQPHGHPPRLEALTTLRFVAAAMVVFGHGAYEFGLRLGPEAIYAVATALSFFFVLSGFVLAWNYPALDGAAERRRFLWLRFARVWPMHLLGIAAVLACVSRATWVAAGIDGPLALVLQLALLHAWVPVVAYLGAFNPLSWTLSVDVFFYALFPFLLAPLRRAPLATLAAALAVSVAGPLIASAFGASRSDLPADAVNLYALDRFFPPSRLAEFVLGMAAARAFAAYRTRLPRGLTAATAIEVAALAATVAVAAGMHRVPHLAAYVGPAIADWASQVGAAPVLACLVVAIAHGRGAIARTLGTRAGVRLGEWGFGMYLLHIPLLHAVSWPALSGAIGALPAALAFGAALLTASWAAWALVEVPSRRALVALYERRVAVAARAQLPVS